MFVKALNINSIEARPSMSITYDIFKLSIKDNLFFGSGPNSFLSQWIVNKPINVNDTIFWNTDFANGIGLIPTFAVTTGLFGILSWLLFLGFFAYLS